MITKSSFLKAYPEGTHLLQADICNKKRSLSWELQFLGRLLKKETCVSDGRRLYTIAIQIYNGRKANSCLNKLVALIQNILACRGFVTEACLYKRIETIGIKQKFNLYTHSLNLPGPKKGLTPRKLEFVES